MITASHFLVALAIILLAAAGARAAARALRQPPVVGEVALGLLIAPVVARVAGADAPGVLLPAPVLEGLGMLAEASLALFLVGIVTELRFRTGSAGRALGWITAGSLIPSAVVGLGVGCWVVAASPASIRGDAPTPAVLLFLVVAMSVTAVPVLARLIIECGLSGTRPASLALGAAVAGDVICWLGLTIALGMAAGATGGWSGQALGLAMCALIVPLGRRLLRSPRIERFVVAQPLPTALLVGVAAPAGAAIAHQVGVSALIGAAAVALALPTTAAWTAVAESVGRVGKLLVPTFFVVTGFAVQAAPGTTVPWVLAGMILVLGVASKIGGGWLGARLGGEEQGTALQVGALLNTRGLTELVVLQIGLTAGVLSASLFIAMALMTVVSTAMTGPLLGRLAAAPIRVREA